MERGDYEEALIGKKDAAAAPGARVKPLSAATRVAGAKATRSEQNEAKADILYEDTVSQVYGFNDFRGVKFDDIEETVKFVATCEVRCP